MELRRRLARTALYRPGVLLAVSPVAVQVSRMPGSLKEPSRLRLKWTSTVPVVEPKSIDGATFSTVTPKVPVAGFWVSSSATRTVTKPRRIRSSRAVRASAAPTTFGTKNDDPHPRGQRAARHDEG